MAVVKTNIVQDVANIQSADGIKYDTPRFVNAKTVEQEKKEQNLAQFGLQNVDDDMEVTHAEYKKTSEKKKELVEATNKKLKRSLEAIDKELGGKVNKIDDE